jgi:hypothetical protein
MKIQLIPALLSLIVALALAYLVYDIAKEDSNQVLLAIGTAVSILLTLGMALGGKTENAKVGVSIKAWSIFAFVLSLIINFLFAWIGVNVALYIAILAVFLVAHLWITWKLSNINNV